MHPSSGHGKNGIFSRLRSWARSIKRDVQALSLAARDPRVLWHVKILALCVTAYALSPIDLIPDFIPVLGFVDDLLIVPLGIWLVARMVPGEVLAEHRLAAQQRGRKPSIAAAVVIVAIWLLAAVVAARWAASHFSGNPD